MIKKFIFIHVLFIFILCSCSLPTFKSEIENIDLSKSIYSSISSSVETYKKEVKLNKIYSSKACNDYFYNQLSETEKTCYTELLLGCMEYSNEINITPISKDELYVAQDALLRDHPEIFWISKFNIIYLEDKCLKVEYKGNNIEETYKQIESITDEILSNSPDSTYDKLKYFYDYIIANTDYEQSNNDQNVDSVFLTKKSVCAGYAKSFKYLCDKAGIECIYASGYADNGTEENLHAWNAVKLNDQWYWVDPTWGDPVYLNEGQSDIINHEYFLIDDNILNKTHVLSNGVNVQDYESNQDIYKMPKCIDDSFYYYSLLGCYFKTYDQNKIESYILSNLDNNPITLKFSNDNDYTSAFNNLVTNEGLKTTIGKVYSSFSYRVKYIDSMNLIKVYLEK